MSDTATRPLIITVGTNPTKLFSQNQNRYSYIIQNQGAAPIFLGKDSTVTPGTGQTTDGRILMPSAMETDNIAEDPKNTRGEIWAIVAAGTCKVWTQEENV
jgi:hypothetical protein